MVTPGESSVEQRAAQLRASITGAATDLKSIHVYAQRAEDLGHGWSFFASLAQCVSNLVVLLDDAGRILACNRTTEATLGLKAIEITGRALWELSISEDQKAFQEELLRTSQRPEVRRIQSRLLNRVGGVVPVAWSCAPATDGSRIVGMVAVGQDLVERRHFRAQLLAAAKVTSLAVIAGGIAHEVRNPLTAALTAVQLLLEHPPSNRRVQAGILQRVRSSLDRATAIVENLLALVRGELGPTQSINLNTLVKETIRLLGPLLAARHVQTMVVLDSGSPLVVGNRILLQQVLVNLLLNASEAMPGGGTVTVTCRREEDTSAAVCVTDTSGGIAPEHLPRVFEPFFTTNSEGGHSGLGLALSYSIVHEHGGSLEVRNEPGRGSAFTVRLPCLRLEAPSLWEKMDSVDAQDRRGA